MQPRHRDFVLAQYMRDSEGEPIPERLAPMLRLNYPAIAYATHMPGEL